ncbi:hypothetical protein Tco_0073428 [Tanacetum coccineum]
MQQFWYIIKKVQGTYSYEFLLANKKCRVDAEVFRKILDICPRVEGKEFTAVQNDDDTLTFLIDLGYKGPLHKYTNMYVDHMSQPWRTLAAIINKCLSEKTASNDRLRKSRIDIMRGMFYRENVDYPELIWEDFAYQIDHRRERKSRRENMPFPRFTKEYGLSIPDMMLNDKIKQLESYQMFIKYFTGQIPPKKSRDKGSQRKKIVDVSQKTVDVSEESEPEHEPVKKILLVEECLTEAVEEEATMQVHATHARIVTESIPKPAKRRSSDPSQKFKGVQSLTHEEQEAADTIKALKESRKTSRRHPSTGGSSEGTCTIPRVPDESTVISATSHEGTGTKPGVPNEEKDISKVNVILEWGSENESEHSNDSQHNFDDEEKKDKYGDADDKSDDHISDTQDTNDEDAEIEYDEDGIYKYKIHVHKDVDVEMAEPKTVERENKEKDVMTDAAKPDVEKSVEEKGDAKNAKKASGPNY